MHDIKVTDGLAPTQKSKKPEFEAVTAPNVHEPSDKVRVKFGKFVQLVATHAFEEVMKRHADQDIILSTNLLTDLANAHEEEEPEQNRRVPIFFIVGILVGIVVTYLIVRL